MKGCFQRLETVALPSVFLTDPPVTPLCLPQDSALCCRGAIYSVKLTDPLL